MLDYSDRPTILRFANDTIDEPVKRFDRFLFDHRMNVLLATISSKSNTLSERNACICEYSSKL